jgi:cell division protein DivIC
MGPAVVAGLALVLTGLFGSAYWDGYQVRREAARLVRERDDLRRQNAQLREEIRLLHTPEYIERLAREQLGLVRPGEIAVILVQPTPAPETAPAEKETGSDGWWARLRRRWSP